MAKSAEEARKVIQKLYPTLLRLLPIREVVKHFYSLQLLSYDRKSQLDSLTSVEEKIAYFLDKMLIPGLSINYTRHFDEMIAMMKKSDDDLTRFLGDRIIEELTLIDTPVTASSSSSSSSSSLIVPRSMEFATTITTDTGIKYVYVLVIITVIYT